MRIRNPSWHSSSAHANKPFTSKCTHGTHLNPNRTQLSAVFTASIRSRNWLRWARTHPHVLVWCSHWPEKIYSQPDWMWSTNHQSKRKTWRSDIWILTGEKVFVNAGVRPRSSSTMAAGRGSSHYCCSTAISAEACCKITAVSEGQYSGDCKSLRDCPTAVGNRWVLFWSVYRLEW